MVKLIATVIVVIFYSHSLRPTPLTGLFKLRPSKPVLNLPLYPPVFNDRGVIKIIITSRYEITMAVAMANI